MYAKCSTLDNAHKLFDEMPERNLISYSTLISSNSKFGNPKLAFHLLSKLLHQALRPNQFIFSSSIAACAKLKSLEVGMQFHGLILKYGFNSNCFVGTSLVDMYGRHGLIESLETAFDNILSRDIALYNAMIGGYSRNDLDEIALKCFIELVFEKFTPNECTLAGVLKSCAVLRCYSYGSMIHGVVEKSQFCDNVIVKTALMDMYLKCGKVEETLYIFKKMKERDVVSWTTVISGLTQMDLHVNAVEVFKTMCSSEIFPNTFTFSSVLKSCGALASINQGKCVHACGIKHGVIDEFTSSSLLYMYAKCGVLEDSRRLFDEIGSKEIVTWNTMITAYAQHGHVQEALELYGMMEVHNLEPNHVTFVSLLSACSHCGMVDDGIQLFELMKRKHGIAPLTEHYACMVYLFGRAGFLERAKLFIDTMPFEADASIWTVFLSACKLNGDFELAQLARKKLDGMLNEDNSILVLVSNMFSEVGKWDDAEKARRKISEDMRKEPGLSWVQTSEASL
ncbi:Pentatricopeptide repeat-containing protein [Platanthera guangdongensis]|uniref:Pentatricopeptide repeat-containing protein n=1 Tax=Platanthera guangdongensis TaxID=2320717 RepID=A0ABR2MUJ5_9ASPA